ncbi:fatty aldehyde dehydrogenase Hfd1p [[Candida] jaroonii]|uniref:Fatty aldehyde dehydrogenase Hfd1p n=1 Tax=[Candida] jaroonii TaxID=467808 RepID=A0ACA9Y130_9ASCO|nr:fatty aldehyde dehydrogenase Hfd1p [[Candida] jaroonii]
MSKPTKVESISSKEGSITSPLRYTSIQDIPKGVDKLVASYHETHKMDSIQYRLNQIRNVYFAIKDNADLICEALEKDFYRSPSETKSLELGPLLNEIIHTMGSIYKWSKPEPVSDKTINVATQPVYIERIPLGVVLVISPFNYPLLLSVSAVVGALSGGNHVVLKQSESTPHFTQLLSDLLTDALDNDVFFAVNGAIPETTELLNQKFDKIMYTGNGMVGTIIAKKAAETLTPVILELGGKSPGFVFDINKKDLPTLAKRILWGKFTNAGQTCVAIDYLLVEESIKGPLVDELIKQAEVFFESPDHSSDITHIIHDRAYTNLVKTIKSTKGKIVSGGKTDDATRFIEPTIIDNVKFGDSTMRQELFGPVLPILTYSDLESTVKSVVKQHDTPLALYCFTSGKASRSTNPKIEYITKHIRSGGVVINDTLIHVALPNAPFGGVGMSGYGSYHGYFSYRSFTHERTFVEQAFWNDAILKSRYPPYNETKNTVIASAMVPHREWFGRSGDVQQPSIFFNIWNSVATLTSIGYTAVVNRI